MLRPFWVVSQGSALVCKGRFRVVRIVLLMFSQNRFGFNTFGGKQFDWPLLATRFAANLLGDF